MFLVINDMFLHIFKITYSTKHVFAWYRHKNPLVWYFKITKRPNRPKKSISVPENLSITLLEHYYKILNPTTKKWDVGTKTLFYVNLDYSNNHGHVLFFDMTTPKSTHLVYLDNNLC